jgi:predicted dehydrogenase
MALEGKIKSPLFIESRRLSPFPNRSTDVDVILDLMIHDIDIILSLVNSDIESIDAVGIPVVTNSVDITNARLRFTNGCVADVTANRVSRVKERTINIYQPETNISIDYAAQHITITDITPDKEAGFAKLVDTELDIVKSDSLLEEIKAFLACSEHNRRPLVSGHEGLIALEVASRIQEAVANSMQRGRN